jgi:Tol biopolymer transport system component
LSRRIALFVALGAVVGALLVSGVQSLRDDPPPAPSPPAIRLTFSAPPGAELGSGDESLDAAISPDETQVVFVATTGGIARLWRRPLDGDTATALAGTDGARFPAWKQTGGVVSFFADGTLRQIALADGAVRTLADAPSPAGATWLADGSLLFAGAANAPLQRLRAGVRSDATTLQPGDRAHVFPVSTTPGLLRETRPTADASETRPADADSFLYIALRDDGRRVVRLASGGQSRDLTTTSGHAQLVDDQLLHVRDGVLVAERIDPVTGRTSGRAAPLATSAGVSAAGHASFAASPRLLIVAPSAPRVREMAWVEGTGARSGTVAEPGDYWQVRLSPDDQYVAATMIDPLLRTLDVIVVPAQGTAGTEKLTLALAADADPVWAPDSSRLVFRSMEDGTPKLFVRRSHDTAAPIEPHNSAPRAADRDDTPTDWRGGRLLLTTRGDAGTDIWALDATGTERTAVATTGFNESDGRWSPDSAWVAYVSDESGQPEIYAVRLPPSALRASAGPPKPGEGGKADPANEGERTRVSFAGGAKPRWSADGRSLFFLRGSQIMRADVEGGRFGTPRPIDGLSGVSDFDAAHRGRRLLVLLGARTDPVSPMTVVNWATPLAGVQSPPSR